MTKFQTYARTTYTPGSPIDEMWHPEIIAECIVINDEAKAAAEEAARTTIKEVIVSVSSLEDEFRGNISVYHSFRGSVTMEKQFSKEEKELMKKGLPDALKEAFKGRKILFPRDPEKPTSEPFPEWKKFQSARTAMAMRLKSYGVPFISDSTTMVKIVLIPEIEKFFKKIEADLAPLLEAVISAWPVRVSEAKARLGDFFDPRDYQSADQLAKEFAFKKKWMHFGIPDVLKEISPEIWEIERRRTAEAWAEVKQNGILLLRKEVSGMVERLNEAMRPAADGEKKKFYATAVTNMTDFFTEFENRNIVGDDELKAEIEKLKKLVTGRDIEAFKSDDSLRAKVKKETDEIKDRVASLLVVASSRQIKLED